MTTRGAAPLLALTAVMVLLAIQPPAAFAARPGRCGAYDGSDAVEASRDGTGSPLVPATEVVRCKKDVQAHEIELVVKRVDGARVEVPVFASKSDMPERSNDADISESEKASDQASSDQASSSSTSFAGAVGFVVSLADINGDARRKLQQVRVPRPPPL